MKLKILNKLLIILLSVALPSFEVSQVVLDDSFGNEGVLEGPDFINFIQNLQKPQ